MHVIRLHGAWEFEPLAADDAAARIPPPGRANMPADWERILGPGWSGRVRCTRRFHRPTGLEPGGRVWLVVDAVNTTGAASLNGRPLAATEASGALLRFEIAGQLEPANELTLDLQFPGGAIHAARLEIES